MFVLTLTYYKGCIVTVINIIKHQIRHFIALLANINRTGGSRSSWATCTGAHCEVVMPPSVRCDELHPLFYTLTKSVQLITTFANMFAVCVWT